MNLCRLHGFCFINMENKINKQEQDSDENIPRVFRLGVSPVKANFRIGPLRSHLYNYSFAQHERNQNVGSKIFFRVDDSNQEKGDTRLSRQLFSFFGESFGMVFDKPDNQDDYLVYQSERQALYKSYLEGLFDKGFAFIDKESGLTLFDVEKYLESNDELMFLDDVVRGQVVLNLRKLLGKQKYFPLVRSNGVALYHLASVVDDAELGVTHVVRGSDKFPIAHYQEMVRIALGLEPKKFMHTPLMLGDEGKLLKGDVMYNSFLQRGFLPQALVSYMISSGYGDPDVVYDSISDFIDNFDYKKVRQVDGKFSQKKLESINRRIFSGISEDDYYISLKLYMAKFLQEKEVNDDYVSVLQKLKIPFEKVEQFLNNVEDPKYSAYELMPEDVRSVLRHLVSVMEGDNFDINEFYFSTDRLYLRALRFFVFGDHEVSGGIREVFDLISTRGLISDRILKLKKLL